MKRRLSVPFLVLTSMAYVAFAPASASAAPGCALVAAPWGSDQGTGSVESPLRTVQALVGSLSAGQTGCLRGGTYEGDVTIAHGGQPGEALTLESYPGETATIVGRIWITQQASNVILEDLDLNGTNAESLPSPTINGDDVTFARDEVTNDNTAICFDIGSNAGWGVAQDTIITLDRIHNCGVEPPTNHEHGIYVEDAIDTMIEWNLIYANADRGIQLYPDAQDTTIDHNVIDDNGEGIIFSGDFGLASDGSNVYDNLLTDSTQRFDAESWYPQGNPLGTGNVLHDNCLWGGREGPVNTSAGGFEAVDNIVADPRYVDAADHNYHLLASSPCLALTGDIAAEVPGASDQQPVATPQSHRSSRVKAPTHSRRSRAAGHKRAGRKHRAHRRHAHTRRYRLR
jgi:hypothetical protein